MLFSIVEGSGSIVGSSVLMHSHSGEIAPTIMEALTRVQLGMVEDPGVKLLGRWVRDEMTVPSLPQLRVVVSEIHQVPVDIVSSCKSRANSNCAKATVEASE